MHLLLNPVKPSRTVSLALASLAIGGCSATQESFNSTFCWLFTVAAPEIVESLTGSPVLDDVGPKSRSRRLAELVKVSRLVARFPDGSGLFRSDHGQPGNSLISRP